MKFGSLGNELRLTRWCDDSASMMAMHGVSGGIFIGNPSILFFLAEFPQLGP